MHVLCLNSSQGLILEFRDQNLCRGLFRHIMFTLYKPLYTMQIEMSIEYIESYQYDVKIDMRP